MTDSRRPSAPDTSRRQCHGTRRRGGSPPAAPCSGGCDSALPAARLRQRWRDMPSTGGAVETRKRCKIVAGQTVSFEGQSVTVTA